MSINDENSTLGIEMVIQLCRMQVQREREKLHMTPKLSGALESLKKLRSFADDEAVKLTKRINEETMPALTDAFKKSHATVDGTNAIVNEIDEFTEELKKTNGGDPLGYSETQSSESPRSSEVASR